MMVFADNFLAGAIISLLMPAILLVVIWTWYWYSAKRRFSSTGVRGDARPQPGTEVGPTPGSPEAAPPAP